MTASPIIAHRGLSSLCPENTLIAMKGAAKAGATWVEADVQVLQNGTPVIIHDFDISRTTDSEGTITELTEQDISKIDAGLWFEERFEGERIPTLYDLLEELDNLGMGLNLEIKYDIAKQGVPKKDEITFIVDSIFKGLKFAPAPPRGMIISSYYLPFLQEARNRDDKINLGYIVLGYEEKYIQEAKKINAVSLHINKEVFLEVDEIERKKRLETIKGQDLEIYVYTVNRKEDGKQLFDLGVDGIFTDYPQRFPRYLP